jgi:hypothetical protein
MKYIDNLVYCRIRLNMFLSLLCNICQTLIKKFFFRTIAIKFNSLFNAFLLIRFYQIITVLKQSVELIFLNSNYCKTHSFINFPFNNLITRELPIIVRIFYFVSIVSIELKFSQTLFMKFINFYSNEILVQSIFSSFARDCDI